MLIFSQIVAVDQALPSCIASSPVTNLENTVSRLGMATGITIGDCVEFYFAH